MKRTASGFALLLALMGLILLLPHSAAATAADEEVTGSFIDLGDGLYEYISQDDAGWVKTDGDVWVYEFSVFDDNQTYYLYEEEVPGYFSNENDPANPVVIIGAEDKTGVVTNTSTTEYGGIQITKTVSGTTTTQKFRFTVTLAGDGIGGRQVIDGVAFVDGVAHISLGDGEGKTISGIPAGTSYTVTESAANHFTVTATGTVGTVVGGETAVAAFTNTYNPPSYPLVDVVLRKEEQGNFQIPRTYGVYASFDHLLPDESYAFEVQDETGAVAEMGEFRSDAQGEAVCQVRISADKTVIFRNLNENARYRFTEEAGDYVSEYRIENAGSRGSIATPSGRNSKTNTSLSTAWETAQAGEQITVTYVNTLTRAQSLVITKTVEGEHPEKAPAFPIHIQFEHVPQGTYLDSSIGRFKPDEDDSISIDTTLRHGGQIRFDAIPVGVSYTVSEEFGQYEPRYVITDAQDMGKIVQAEGTYAPPADPEDEEETPTLSTAREVVDEGEEISVSFINAPETEKYGELSITKTVSGNYASTDHAFRFTVSLTDPSGVPYTGKLPATREQDGHTYEMHLTLDRTGSATLELKHGETVVISNIPAGLNYAVTEDPEDYEQIRADGTEGVIPEEDRAEAVFENYRHWSPLIPTGVWVQLPVAFIAAVAVAAVLFLVLRRRKKR